MTAALERALAVDPLAPINASLQSIFGTSTRLPGLAPGLVVRDDHLIADTVGWLPATDLVNGRLLPQLLEAAKHRWQAQPHAAGALAWKAYTYWLALPAVLGWASARRVPLLDPANVLVHFEDKRPLITIGLAPSIGVAVLPTDPLALTGLPQVKVVSDEEELLRELRASLLDAHITPMVEALHGRVRLGTRTLLGSLAAGVAYGVLRIADAVPGRTVENVDALLTALDVADLVELVPGPGGQLTVQRKTCCLAFTLPRPKVCAGCCIKTPPPAAS